MRPSQYHYIKRMWARYFYKRSMYKKKHGGIFFNIFKWMMILAFWPFVMVALIFMAISNTIGIKRFFKFCGIAFIVFSILSFIYYGINNFFKLFGIGPIIAIILVVVFVFIWFKFIKKDLKSNKNDVVDHQNIIDEKPNVDQNEKLHTTKICKESKPDASEVRSLNKPEEKEAELWNNLDIQENSENIVKVPDKKDDFDVYKYAIMCNAYLEHQEEMEQYREEK